MLVRLFFSGYSKLLAGISMAAMAVVLTGCNDKVAEIPQASPPPCRCSRSRRPPWLPLKFQLRAWNSLKKTSEPASDPPQGSQPPEECRLLNDKCQYSSVIMKS